MSVTKRYCLPRLLTCVLLFIAAFPAISSAQAADPVAAHRSIVQEGNARFTILTPQLIRMEWAEDGRFEDHASLVFINRKLPVPPFRTGTDGRWLTVATDRLTLRYRRGSGRFAPDNLSVELSLNNTTIEWHPGMEDRGNLGGTIRTLDGVKGDTPLEPGLISRDGWVLIDDSARPLFDDSDWHWAMPRPDTPRQDWYIFGHGHDYKKAIEDFTRVAGRIPIPPRFAFGTWWSRYWSYTDQEFEELVRQFETFDVPLDVLVIDMDWHMTFGTKWSDNKKDQSGHTLGWTGYTWNRILFPDPAGFLRWCDRHGLKTPLNLHPASGVQPHEERYPDMARAMGIDPATRQYVPFDIADKKFAENYLEILHHPLEAQGVDFWWLDWQQEQKTALKGLNPTWWLNYLHTSDMERRGKRPLILHRWGGLGNHRYQIGFSGDTISVWESLAFQPYFTATAANVGYGYWSHDIGGHMPGKVSPELYTRWIQYGVFSPILRTHTTKNPEAERRIWAYPVDYFLVMRGSFLLRYALIPYIYTAAREAYDTGVSICRPMYYDYPEADDAYRFRNQYMFGDSMLIAPVTTPASEESLLSEKEVWLPEGNWIEWFTGARLQGPALVKRSFSLKEVPVYVKAGAVVPMQPKMRHTGEQPVDPLILTIFPGDAGLSRVYEDEGDSLGYKSGKYSFTTIRHSKAAGRAMTIEILPAEGDYPGMPAMRGYEIRLPGSWAPEGVSYNGKPIPFAGEGTVPGWRYEGDLLMPVVSIPSQSLKEKVEVQVRWPASLDPRSPLLDGFPMKRARLESAMHAINAAWPEQWSPDILVELVQTGRRIGLNPKTAPSELETFHRRIPEAVNEIGRMGLDPAALALVTARLGGLGAVRR